MYCNIPINKIKNLKTKIYSLYIILFLSQNAFSQEKPFKVSKQINQLYYSQVKSLIKVNDEKLNEDFNFELYKEIENKNDGPEWNYSAVIKIGDYFYPIKLGIEHSIQISDISGNDNLQEIIIDTGCFSDAGCGGQLIIINIYKNQAFLVTDFGGSTLANESDNLYSTYKKDLSSIKKAGEFAIISDYYDKKNNKCYYTLQSFKKSTKGFAKGLFFKKIIKECVG